MVSESKCSEFWDYFLQRLKVRLKGLRGKKPLSRHEFLVLDFFWSFWILIEGEEIEIIIERSLFLLVQIGNQISKQRLKIQRWIISDTYERKFAIPDILWDVINNIIRVQELRKSCKNIVFCCKLLNEMSWKIFDFYKRIFLNFCLVLVNRSVNWKRVLFCFVMFVPWTPDAFFFFWTCSSILLFLSFRTTAVNPGSKHFITTESYIIA